VNSENDLDDAEVYFQLLEKLDKTNREPDAYELGKQIEQLFALPDVKADASIQIMTIHKSKGLEFDTVIVPGLGRGPRSDDTRLLNWLETNEGDLLLAPIHAQGESKNPMASYLQQLENVKQRHENSRLLYVATTRAKQYLHLLGHVNGKLHENDFEIRKPQENSLLACLWPVLEEHYQSFAQNQTGSTQPPENTSQAIQRISIKNRLVSNWSLPAPPQAVRFADVEAETTIETTVEFDWASETARHVGTVVHRLLQHTAEHGLEQSNLNDMSRFEQLSHTMLVRLGLPVNHLKTAIEQICTALQTTFNDKRGQWILSADHSEAACELAVSCVRNKKIQHMIIDRTFVDEQGTRWIIDYKTGSHSGSGIKEFLDREQDRYRRQLEGYAHAISKMEQRQVRLGLYFPVLGEWREWPYQL
ncbi:MAG TPA: DNA helicase UvrD, partial [Crenotrichaceae bacterium]|nr:DNA helicase UvrD [Crenotrichaceae bacterium]